MVGYKVHFRKGLSIPAFLESYSSEEQCESALFHARWPSGLACGGEQFSLLAGTIFQATKLPLTVCFLAMYRLSRARHGIPALAPGRQLAASPSTGWLLKHKLMQVMLESDAGRKLEGRLQVDDAYPGGERPGGKPGRGPESKTTFLAAVQVTDDGQPVVMKLGEVAGFRKDAVEEWAAENVEPGTTLNTDGTGCFKGFAAAGCEHTPRVTGGGPGSCDTPGPGWVNTVPGNVKRSLDGTYHGLLPKYAARYLAEFQYRFNRRYNLAALPRPVLELHPYGC